MSAESDADRLALLNTDEFGVDATYTPVSGSPSAIQVLFINPYLGIPGDDADTASSDPHAMARAIDVPSVAEGDTLTIDGTVWTIRNPQPDGAGMVRLELEGAL